MPSEQQRKRRLVIVGFAEAASAPEVVWSLADAGFDVLAFARRGRASALRRSRFVRCVEVCPPEKNVQQCLADLAAVTASAEGRSPILFPLDDTALWICNQGGISDACVLAAPSGQAAVLALNKDVQVAAAARAGFRVPESRVANTWEELLAAVDTFPVILKRSQCVAVHDGRVTGARTWICANRDELDRVKDEWTQRAPLLVQPFITGVGEGIFGLATGSEVRAWSGHRRLRMMNPAGSGSSACVSTAVSDELKAAAQTFLREAGWRGLFMIELLRDAEGRVWFVELNGRPWGSMALARRQGLEYPAWHIEMAIEPQSSAGEGRAGDVGRVCRNIGREIMHLLFVLRGPRSRAMRQWPSTWSTVGAVLGVRPGDSLYNWRWNDPLVFVSDCYYTVRGNIVKGER